MSKGLAQLRRAATFVQSNFIDVGAIPNLPPIRGTWYFVDPYAGSDTGRTGKSLTQAFASVNTAYDACVSGRGDGIAVYSGGITTANTTTYLAEAITWSKWGITTVGICAPTLLEQRARIANLSTVNDLSALITVTGSNNSFANLHLYNGGTTGTGCFVISGGERNYFYRVHMLGAGGVTSAGTSDNDLTLTGASANTFEMCVFGSDTKDRGNNASASIHFGSGCMRNRFIGCEVVKYHSTGTGGGAIKWDGSGDAITRDQVFKSCLFTVYDEANGSAQTSVVIGTAPNNGCIILMDCAQNGFADWCAVAAARVISNMPAAADTGGKMLAQNPS